MTAQQMKDGMSIGFPGSIGLLGVAFLLLGGGFILWKRLAPKPECALMEIGVRLSIICSDGTYISPRVGIVPGRQ
jgi:hypothetical protein